MNAAGKSEIEVIAEDGAHVFASVGTTAAEWIRTDGVLYLEEVR